MHMIVVGCGRVGSQLAYRLFQRGLDVTALDEDARAFGNLPPDFRGRTVEGDVLTREVLRRVRMESAAGVAAVTSSDTVNAVVALIARRVYNVPRVVVRNYNPRFVAAQEAIGVEAVSSTRWGAQRMEGLLTETGVHSVYSAGAGEVQVYEFVVPDRLAGRKLAEIIAGSGGAVVALTRGGAARVPAADETIEPGDVVHVGCSPQGVVALQDRLLDEEG